MDLGSLGTFLPIILIIAVFYLLVMRPQAKKRKAQQEQLQAVKPGDRIMTTAGLFGTVAEVIDDKFELEVAPGVRVTMLKAAIAQIITEPPAIESIDSTEAPEPPANPSA